MNAELPKAPVSGLLACEYKNAVSFYCPNGFTCDRKGVRSYSLFPLQTISFTISPATGGEYHGALESGGKYETGNGAFPQNRFARICIGRCGDPTAKYLNIL